MTNFFKFKKFKLFSVLVFLGVFGFVFFDKPINTKAATATVDGKTYTLPSELNNANPVLKKDPGTGAIYLLDSPISTWPRVYTIQNGQFKYATTCSSGMFGGATCNGGASNNPALNAQFEEIAKRLGSLYRTNNFGSTDNIYAGTTTNDAGVTVGSNSVASTDICSASSLGGAALNTATVGIASFFGVKGNIFTVIQCIISGVLYFILWILSLVLAIVGGLFNWVFRYTVVDIKENLEVIKVIPVAWAAVRDLANICFIFILLYLAIATILQLDEHGVKHSLSRLIIAAVLINFSLFFTKVIIDVPNILAINIYNKAMATAPPNSDLGDVFMNIISPQSVYKDLAKKEFDGTNASQGTIAGQNPITTHAMGIIIMVIAIGVFGGVTIIFIKRFVMLIFYMIFSPLAFAGMAIPAHSLEHMAKEKFWNGLIKEALYAPIFMMCVYVTLLVGSALKDVKIPIDASWSILSAANAGVGNIISFSVIMVMLVASLIIAESMGVQGASGAMNVYKSVTSGAMGAARFVGGAAYNNTIGKAAETYYNKTHSQDLFARASGIDAHGNPVGFLSRWSARGQLAVAKGMSGGYREKISKEEEYNKGMAEEFHGNTSMMANKLIQASMGGQYNTAQQAMDKSHHTWTDEQHANVQLQLAQQRAEAVTAGDNNRIQAIDRARERYYTDHGHGRLEEDQAVNVEKLQQEKLLAFHKETLRNGLLARDAHGNITGVNGANMAAADPATGAPAGAMRTFYDALTDRQKVDFISSLTQAEQNALAADGNFQAALTANLNTFDMVEKAGKGPAVSADMKAILSNISYEAMSRANSARALRGATAARLAGNMTQANYDTIAREFETAHGAAANSINTGNAIGIIDTYQAGNNGRNDSTFRNADRNLSRFLPSNAAYEQMVQRILAAGGTIPRD